MADGDRIIIGQANIASNPGNMTSLSRNAATNRTVFVARNLNAGDGIQGQASGAGRSGVLGLSNAGAGVAGSSSGVFGQGTTGVFGVSTVQGFGVYGSSGSSGIGVKGEIDSGVGVQGHSVNGAGVWGKCDNPSNNVSDRRAGGVFEGGVVIVNGLKPFTIDHPLDPENRYLVHTSVESSEMKNVYDGVARLDEAGAAWVELPEWFEALNGDFRYQLTAVGGSAPELHVAEEISENRFKIAGGQAGMKVCWQVTGSRKDPWAAANPFEVDQEKREEERGRYLDPSLYNAPEEQRVMIGPIAEAVEEEQRIGELRQLAEEHRREMEELRQRMEESQEEGPPEST